MTCSDPTLPCGPSNLALRPVELYRAALLASSSSSYVLPPVHVHLSKRVPLEGGLGGGSANAATVLHGLDVLVRRSAEAEAEAEAKGGLGGERLSELSESLGSDVTFFLDANRLSGSALCTGRGEVIDPTKVAVGMWEGAEAEAEAEAKGNPKGNLESNLKSKVGALVEIFKVKNCGCGTPSVFAALNLAVGDPFLPPLLGGGPPPTGKLLGVSCGPAGGRFVFGNDLEEAAFSVQPRIRRLKEEMVRTGRWEVVMMSGSGASLFAIGDRGERGERGRSGGGEDGKRPRGAGANANANANANLGLHRLNSNPSRLPTRLRVALGHFLPLPLPLFLALFVLLRLPPCPLPVDPCQLVVPPPVPRPQRPPPRGRFPGDFGKGQ